MTPRNLKFEINKKIKDCMHMDPPSSSSSSPPLPHKSKNVSAMKSHDQVECAAIYLYTLTSFSFLLIINSFTNNKSTIDGSKVTTSSLGSKTLNPLTFYPLKDFNVPSYRNPNKTWFMAPLMSQPKHSLPEHIVFPSKPPNYHKVLCIDPHNESYALATSNNSFPKGGVIARGMAFLANNLYDYDNPWHGLNAVLPFFTWMRERGRCEKPKRFVLFRNGKVVKKTGEWLHEFIKAMLDGEEALIDGIEEFKDRNVVCFEKAVVMKRGLGGMEGKKRHRLFETVRCKAWKFCGVEAEDKEDSEVRISLVVRGGKRGFKNESRIREVMERECRRISDGGSRACRLQVVHLGNMSFCDQVRAMRNTNIMASTHGAQLTNMVFMPKGSSVMEMFPTGWLEGAGTGQFIYKWFADWSEMNYKGAWRDPNDLSCNKLLHDSSECFVVQKNQKVRVDEAYLAAWTSKVINDVLHRKRRRNFEMFDGKCPCS